MKHDQPNTYMIYRTNGVLAIAGAYTTNVRHDEPAQAAEKVLAGKVAFVAARKLHATGAAIAEGMNAAALAAAAGGSTAGGFAEPAGAPAEYQTTEALAALRVGEFLPADTQVELGTPPPLRLASADAHPLAELREEFGHYFDAIGDVDAWCKAQRRGDDLPEAQWEGD